MGSAIRRPGSASASSVSSGKTSCSVPEDIWNRLVDPAAFAEVSRMEARVKTGGDLQDQAERAVMKAGELQPMRVGQTSESGQQGQDAENAVEDRDGKAQRTDAKVPGGNKQVYGADVSLGGALLLFERANAIPQVRKEHLMAHGIVSHLVPQCHRVPPCPTVP